MLLAKEPHHFKKGLSQKMVYLDISIVARVPELKKKKKKHVEHCAGHD